MINKCLKICAFLFVACLPVTSLSQVENPQEKQTKKDTLIISGSLKQQKLKTPKNIVESYKYNPSLDKYVYSQKIGDYDISVPMFLTRQEYEELIIREKTRDYFRQKSNALGDDKGKTEQEKKMQRDLLPEFYVKSELFESIFGGNNIDIIPQGSVAFDLGLRYTKSDNPAMTPENRRNYSIDFDQRISLGLTGQVGERLKVNAMYDTQATFDFQNVFKLEYTPTEDDIVRKVEFGNVSMPSNSSLISGAQSLFGIKTELQFGRTTVSAVFSDQRSQSKTMTSQAGGTIQEFEIRALDYDENRNYFLSQFFRDNYDKALENYPYINSKVQITRVEVWATNRSQRVGNVRNIVALQDLGEALADNTVIANNAPSGFFKGSEGNRPTNQANDYNPLLIEKATGALTKDIRDVATVKNGFGAMSALVNEGRDYAVMENAQKLEEGRDYKVDTKLGYISLSQRLNNDEVLAVAYQYTYEGKVYQVGEFANDGISATTTTYNASNNAITNNCLVLKMLKSNRVYTKDPMWRLMMKNIYYINAIGISPENFRLNIFYSDPSPLNYIQPVDEKTWNAQNTKKILLELFNFDRLNPYNDPQNGGDGFFDFVPGITIDPDYGKIIFTKVEPFGEYLHQKLKSSGTDYNNENTWNLNQKKYVYKQLYTDIKAKAMEEMEKNKFVIKGKYKSKAGKGISLGAFNVPKGSVRVRVGGRMLQEGIDYTVNYQAGTVQIIDPTIENSNMPVEVSVENNLIFAGQTRRFMGVSVNHKISDKFNVGGSFINMRERPFTQKSNYNQEPVNNSIFGFGATYSTELPLLTRLVNKIPTIKTDVPSNLSVRAEMAYLHPSTPNTADFDGEATAYIDDFEGAQATIDIKGVRAWSLASTPLKFVPSANLYGNSPEDPENLKNGYARAKMAWYSIDPLFYHTNRPAEIGVDEISKNSTRRIFIDEIFPEQEVAQGETLVQTTLDLAYFPDKKGPYNNNPKDMNQLSAEEKWAGIMRGISTTNFEENNIEYIQFWMLDPYSTGEFSPSQGELVFDLGNISEDVLKDGRKQYENGLPGLSVSSQKNKTSWGGVPAAQSIMYAFDTNEENRKIQDVGLDGLDDQQEKNIYTNNIAQSPSDPALDNYEFYLNRSGGIVNRYLNYNGLEGNSPVAVSDTNRGSGAEPDVEDANRDNTMNTINSYSEFRIPLGANITRTDKYVTDIREVNAEAPNGTRVKSRWIQYKIPIKNPDASFGSGGADLRSVTHIRMYLTGFKEEVVVRFATLDLVRGDWRFYTKTLSDDLDDPSDDGTIVETNSVSVIENESRQPIPYKMPPGVYREQINTNNTLVKQNEQALSFVVSELENSDSRGVYKNIDVDLRQYKKIKMFTHAESHNSNPIENADVVAFIRLGSDFTQNYYQVELPLRVTPAGANSQDAIWPVENMFDIDMETLTKLKARGINEGTLNNITYYDASMNVIQNPSNTPYTLGEQRYGVKGNPSLGNVRTVMIGLKNASGYRTSAEVWFNELRISQLENKGGWATIGAIDLNAADFINMSMTGRMSTVGFGSVEQKPNERSKEEIKQFDAMVNVNAGQLLPQKWQMQIPVGLSLSKSVATPEYDPQYEDIKLKDRLQMAESKSQKDKIEEQAQDYTLRKGISLIGVRKALAEGQKPKIYSVENITLNHAYNQMDHHDFEIEKHKEQAVRTGATYNYGFEPMNIQPFKKNKQFSNAKYWQWLKDFNINPMPASITFATNINRTFSRQTFREVMLDGVDPSLQVGLPELQQKNYMFDWNYAINYNLTKSLKATFDATNSNIVRNYYTYDTEGNKVLNKELTIWDDFFNTGETNHYMSALKINYELPLDKLPYLSFLKSAYSYTADFDWQRGSDAMKQVAGQQINSVQNASGHNFTANMSFERFYRDFGVKAKKKSEKRDFKDSMVAIATMIKKIGVNYNQTDSQFLPGYLEGVGFWGTSKPSVGFVFGSQSDDIRYNAARKGWLINKDKFDGFSEQFISSTNKNLTINANLEPSPNLQIDLNADRQYTDNFEESFQVVGNSYNPMIGNKRGNFSISTNMIMTSFSKSNEYSSKTFEKFKKNRITIAQRLARQRGGISTTDQDGFPSGYGKNSQQVLIPALYAAYTGKNAEKTSLDAFKNIPIPNWNVRYTGLMEIDAIKKNFKRFSITHGYRSSYTLTDFRSNLEYDPAQPDKTDQGGNFRSQKLFTNVNLIEQFSPLLRIDAEMQNSISVLTEIRKDRTVSISLDNNYLTEISGKEYRVGLGYRIKDIRIPMKFNGENIMMKSDINIKGDISLRNDFTVIRNMELSDNQVTSGQTSWMARLSADYSLSAHLSALYYLDYSFSKYAISTSFPMTTIRTGITVKYTF